MHSGYGTGTRNLNPEFAFGSNCDVAVCLRHGSFTPESGHGWRTLEMTLAGLTFVAS
jgi:hypothetical protein